MYSWIWNKLPGNKFFKAIQALILLAAVVVVLYLFVFPAIDGFVYPEPQGPIQ